MLSADRSKVPCPAENWYLIEIMSYPDELWSNKFTGSWGKYGFGKISESFSLSMIATMMR